MMLRTFAIRRFAARSVLIAIALAVGTCWLSLAGSGPVALAQDPSADANVPAWQAATPLEIEDETLVRLPSEQGYLFRSYSVDVTEDIIGRREPLTISLRGPEPTTSDFDLYVRTGRPIKNWLADPQYRAISEAGSASISIPVEELVAGAYYIDVRTYTSAPCSVMLKVSAGGESMVPIDPVVPPVETSGWLLTGVPRTVQLPRPDGTHYITFALMVPEYATSLTITLRGSNVDMDVYIRHGEPMAEWTEADHEATSDEPDETLTVTGGSAPPLAPGLYYVDVTTNTQMPARVTVLATIAPLSPPDPNAPPSEVEWGMPLAGVLADGQPVEVSLPLDEAMFAVYGVTVPEGVSSLLVTLRGGTVDLDLFGTFDEPLVSRDVAQVTSTSMGADETLYFGENTAPACQPGRYYFMVLNYANMPDTATLTATFNAEPPAGTATGVEIVPLTIGERYDATIDKNNSALARFTVEVPESAEALFVVLENASSDLDMYARFGEPMADQETDCDIRAYSGRLNETIVIDATTEPALQVGTYYIDVVSLISIDTEVDFTIIATLDTPPVDSGAELPPYGSIDTLSQLDRVLQGVVSVEAENGSGSGTVLTPTGLILTNHHVISDDSEEGYQQDDIYVSFTNDSNEPPTQVFVARTLFADGDIDLALIQVYATLTGDELDNETLDLVWLPIGDPYELHHGENLRACGFPSVGGFQSRSSVTLVKGIVAGFIYSSDDGEMDWIKTDAEIASGNSGGAALNDRNELVGVPTRVRLNADDKLSYCRTVNRIPEEWLERVREDLTDDSGTEIVPDDENPVIVFRTNLGDITFELFEDGAPNSVANIIELIEQGFYDGLRFHRVIDAFMIQGGDPLSADLDQRDSWGTGDPGYSWPDEDNGERVFDRKGLLAMANAGPDTNGSQFFITLVPTPWLSDGDPMNRTGAHHNIFGEVIEGMDVVEAIGRVETNARACPIVDVIIELAWVAKKRAHEYHVQDSVPE